MTEGMDSCIREDNGRGWDLCERMGTGMGPPPPSSRGQDLDARTTGGDGGEGGFQTRFYEIDCNVGVNCTGKTHFRSGGIQRG